MVPKSPINKESLGCRTGDLNNMDISEGSLSAEEQEKVIEEVKGFCKTRNGN